MRKVAVLLASLVAGPALLQAQPIGSVLTSSDIYSDHLIERPVTLEGRAWLALTTSAAGSRLEAVRPSWATSMLFQDSVFTLVLDPPMAVTPLLMVADVPRLAVGPAMTVVELEKTLWDEALTLDVSLGSETYRLSLGGTDPMRCDATVTLSDGRAAQTLYAPGTEPFDCDEPHFSVQWAGDVDGDGRLDLVTTFSPKYSWYPRRLYLSSAAAPGELVGLVAVLEAAAA
jgi:hypothetical protein